MSNTGLLLKKIDCKDEKYCTTNKYHCATCLRNKANKYEDKFSIRKEGYNPMGKWK